VVRVTRLWASQEFAHEEGGPGAVEQGGASGVTALTRTPAPVVHGARAVAADVDAVRAARPARVVLAPYAADTVRERGVLPYPNRADFPVVAAPQAKRSAGLPNQRERWPSRSC